MSEEKKEPTRTETHKPQVRDLEPEKDAKGGGGKPKSGGGGGDTTQPIPTPGS